MNVNPEIWQTVENRQPSTFSRKKSKSYRKGKRLTKRSRKRTTKRLSKGKAKRILFTTKGGQKVSFNVQKGGQ
jgi:hypothetical protein